MKLKELFTKKSAVDETTCIIRDEMLFLLERNERWFEKKLQAHLLNEGCNYPLSLARLLFYELMISGLLSRANSAMQEKFDKELPFIQKILAQHKTESAQENEYIGHEEFYIAMRFFEANLENPGKQMALEIINSIERIEQEWRLDENVFQKQLDQFDTYTQTIINRLWKANKTEFYAKLSPELVRRRLYMALTTSLLSKMNVRNAFEAEFRSIPQVLQAMQDDHAVFCRFMKFCQERTPYFTLIVSQTFWRTLETLRMETVSSEQ